jgi:hypothetical protein
MIFSKADLPEIKWSLGAFVLSLAIASTLISLGEKYLSQARNDRQAAQKQLADARAQLSSTESDQENMAAYALEFNSLVARKVIGNEQRLDWMEGLERLRQQGVVLDLKYTISPQQNYKPEPPVDTGNFQLNRSAMSMQVDLLHEEQLLHLLTDMRSQVSGWFMLDGCTLSRTAAVDELAPLKAECTGGWFTMKDKNAP